MYDSVFLLSACLMGKRCLIPHSWIADVPVQPIPSSHLSLITSRCSRALGLLWGWCLTRNLRQPSDTLLPYQQASVVSYLLVAGSDAPVGRYLHL